MGRDDDTNGKIDAIVGAAVRALANGQSDDKTLGAFAASFRRKVAATLLEGAAEPEPPDLLAVIRQAVSDAIREERGGILSERRLRKARVTVQVKGVRTSVTISADLADKYTQVFKGNKQAARNSLNSLAESCPAGVIRSQWMEERMRAVVVMEAERSNRSATH